jgi:hypothetical protein
LGRGARYLATLSEECRRNSFDECIGSDATPS